MSEKKHFIRVDEQAVLVTEEVYRTYFQMAEHERYLERKDQWFGKTLYSNMDTNQRTGEEMIPHRVAKSVEDIALERVMVDKLHACLALLETEERELIKALYFKGYSERKWAEITGLHYMTIHDRKVRALAKCKHFMNL